MIRKRWTHREKLEYAQHKLELWILSAHKGEYARLKWHSESAREWEQKKRNFVAARKAIVDSDILSLYQQRLSKRTEKDRREKAVIQCMYQARREETKRQEEIETRKKAEKVEGHLQEWDAHWLGMMVRCKDKRASF